MDETYIKDNLDRYFILFMEKELEKNKETTTKAIIQQEQLEKWI